jgi:hypothetical protein
MRGERWKEGDWPIEIMTEKRRVKPTTRLKEALGELAGAKQAAAASDVVVVVELKEPEEGERHLRPRRKKAKVEQDADEGTGERTKNTEEERAERNVMAAAAAVMVAPATLPRRGAASKAVEEEKEKTDPEHRPRADALPPEPPAVAMGPVLSGTAMWEQAERAREVQEALQREVYVLENGPAPRVERVEYAVRGSDAARQMSFICRMTDGRGLVQLSKPQVLEHPQGMDVLLDFYERHVIISSKLKDAIKKHNN